MTGIKDASSVSPDLTLGDLGLDSLMGVEIKQTLERDYDISMSAKEIRALTFTKLDQLSTSTPESAVDTATSASEASQAPSASLHYELHHLCPTEAVVEMNHVEMKASPLFVIHPIEGSVFLLGSVMSNIQTTKVYGFQCTTDTPLSSISDLASHYIKVAARVLFLCVFYKISFYCAVLCIAWTILSKGVCLSVTCRYSVEMAKYIKVFFTVLGKHTILVFQYQTVRLYFNRNPFTGVSNTRGMKNRNFRLVSCFNLGNDTR